nr:hypothetical protein [Tanacetum cinerariifolium]
MDDFKLFCDFRWWTIPLDKGIFKEIPSIDGSKSKSIHPSLSSSNESEWENTQRYCVLGFSRNFKQAYYTKDSINMIVGILIFVPGEGTDIANITRKEPKTGQKWTRERI